MRTKLSEKRMLFALLIFAIGGFMLANSEIIPAPVPLAENDLFTVVLSILLMITGGFLIRWAFMKAD